NGIWVETRRVGRDRRTSLIIDPTDGRLPEQSAAAQARVSAAESAHRSHLADNPEELTLSERCIVWGASPPLVPAAYNNNLRIVQTRDHVMILHELMHDARVIPIDGRPHLPAGLREWKGDSRGHW